MAPVTLEAEVTIAIFVSGFISDANLSGEILPSVIGHTSYVMTPDFFKRSRGRSTELCSMQVVTT